MFHPRRGRSPPPFRDPAYAHRDGLSQAEAVRAFGDRPDLLAKQKLPPEVVTKNIWKGALSRHLHFESYLTRNGVVIPKFFLNVLKKEQKRRFLERLEEPQKNWTFSKGKLREFGAAKQGLLAGK